MWTHVKCHSISHRIFYEPLWERLSSGICGRVPVADRVCGRFSFCSRLQVKEAFDIVARNSGGLPTSNYISVFKY